VQFVSGVEPPEDVQCFSKHVREVILIMKIFDTKKDSCVDGEKMVKHRFY
jgi:hypothetical protein